MATKPEQIAFQSKIARVSVLVRGMPFGFSIEVYWSQRQRITSSAAAMLKTTRSTFGLHSKRNMAVRNFAVLFTAFVFFTMIVRFFHSLFRARGLQPKALTGPSKEGQGFNRVEFTIQALEERVLLRPSVA